MKQVTMESIRQRIADLELADNTFGLGLNTEFELACLRELVAVTEQRDALVAESAGLKSALTAILQPGEATLSREHRATAVAAIKTPATDAAIAALRAEGVELFAKKCSEKSKQAISSDTRDNWWLCGEHADDFARQLRESKGEVQS